MNFDFNDEQRAIKEAAREMLAKRYPLEEVRRLALEDERGFTDAQWEEIASLGWPGIFVSEEDGGQGLGIVELVILQEELGYAVAPTPFFSNACAGLLLAAAGTPELKERYLQPLAAGEKRGTLALWDEGQGRDPSASTLEPHGSALTGTKIAVPDAGSADFIVLMGADHRLFLVDADVCEIEPAEGLDPTRKVFTVHLKGCDAHALEHENPEVEHAFWAMCAALAAESTGLAQRAMEMAIEYAKDRKQFDTPIGAFQSVSHRCAQMLLEVEGARSTSYYAAWALDHEPESAALASAMARSYASDAGWRVTASSLQVHGGIGFTWEHDLQFLLKRAKANVYAIGDPAYYRGFVAELAGV